MPMDNAHIEILNRALRGECLNLCRSASIAEAQQPIEARRREYNESRPHIALGRFTPAEYHAAAILRWPRSSWTISPMRFTPR